MSLKATQLLVTVERDLERIPSEVFAHEIPLLEAVHGQGTVQVIEELDEHDLGSVGEEYERLKRKYVTQNADPVTHLFPRAADLARELGVRLEDGPAAKVQVEAAEIIDRAAEKRKAARKTASKAK